MLRDFAYTLDVSLVLEIIDRFEVDFAERLERFALIEFRVITPDSFIWRFLIGNTVYYLYAEDFVTSLDMVKTKILAQAKPGIDIEFMKARDPKPYLDSDPGREMVMFEPPDEDEELMKVVVDSGHDFAFLCRSNESADDALFNMEM